MLCRKLPCCAEACNHSASHLEHHMQAPGMTTSRQQRSMHGMEAMP